MSRLCFSNKKEIVNNFISYCEDSGFKRSCSISFNETSGGGAAFKKLKIDNENYLTTDSGSIFIVGTFFYKRQIGKPAMEALLRDFNGDVCKIRESMNGAFACVIYKDGYLYAFGDATGMYYYYYSYSEETKEWIIGTSLYGLAKSSGLCSVDEYNLLERCFQSNFGTGTVFKDFRKIDGDTCIIVNLNQNILTKQNIGKTITIDTRETEVIVKEAAGKFRGFANMLKDNYGETNISVLMTGGLDSRCMMASLLSEGISPAMYYGVGNSPLAPTTKEDLKVDKIYSEKFHLPLHVLDWSVPDKISVLWDTYIEKYGDIGMMYASSPMVYEGMETINEPLVLVGCFGESYRNHYLVEGQEKMFSVDDILYGYYLPGRNMKKILGDDEYGKYVDRIRSKWNNVLQPYLKNGKFDQDYFAVVEYWKRRYSDALVINFLNQSRYSITMMGEFDHLRYSFLPVAIKNKAGFMIKLVNELYPEVLQVPIYSRYEYKKVNMDKLELEAPQEHKSNGSLMKSSLRSVLGNTFLWASLRKIKRSWCNPVNSNTYLPEAMIMTQTKEDIVKQVKEMLDKLPVNCRDIDSDNSDYLPKDVIYTYFLTMMSKL